MLKKLLLLIVLFVFAAPFACSQTLGTINTIAGGEPNNVPALSVSVGFPSAVARDTAGNLYVGSFYLGGEVFKINPNGILTTVAGNGSIFFETTVNNGDGGLATNATLGYVYGIYVDASQNIYIADGLYNTIRKVTASTGIITTVAGGGTVCPTATDTIGDGCSATSATLAEPYQVIVDANLNLFIADSGNNRIREVFASSGVIQTVAGGGTGCNAQIDSVGDGCTPTQASLNLPTGVFVDGHENLFISDSADDRVREVTAATGLIQTIAGTGDGAYNGDGILATTAEVYYPAGLFVDSSGDVFFADLDNQRIREIVASSGFIQTLAGGGEGCSGQTDTFGDGCPANEAFMVPYDVTVDASNNIYIADETASLAREVVASSGIIQPFAGNGKPSFSGDGGLAKNAQLFYAYGVAADASGNAYIADLDNERIRKVTASTGIIQTVAGGGTGCNAQTDTYGDGCPATQAVLSAPTSVFVDHAGNIFISDYGDSLIREVSASTGLMSLVAGGGTGCPNQTDALGDNCPATQATLSAPWGLYVDSTGDIFIADYNNSRVREVVASTGIIQSIAGTGVDGYNGDNIPANTAEIANPTDLYGDSSGNIYFSDLDNFRIREIVASTGFIQTVAGTGTPGYNGDNILATSADILEPFGLFVDIGGNIFFGDTGNFRIREVVASTGLIQTVGGNGTPGFSGDGGLATSGSIGYVYGLSGDTNGNLFLADTYTNRVREIYGIVPADTLTITTSTLPLASVGTPYSFALQAIDGTPPYTWSLVSGALPPGFSSLSSSGVITGVPTAVGTTTFSVQVNDSANHVQTRTLSLVVTPEGVTLQSIIVEPANSTVAIKGIQPFLAIGNYSDGSSQNLSAAVTWSSATAAVATINAAGVATGVGAGTSTITATLGNINGSTGLTVTATSPYLYVGSVTSANCCLDVLNTSTNQVIKSIPVTTFDEPFGITPDQTRIYIADNVNNLLNVVDTTTNTFVTTIPVGPGATAVAVSPNGQFGYVAEFGDNNVSVFSVTTNTLVATVPIGFASTGLTVSPDGAFVYVGSAIDNRVAVISTSTNTLSSTFALTPPSGQPAAGCVGAPVFNPAGTLGYFLQTCQTASPGSISVVSIPNNSQLTTILLGIAPYDDVITPDGTQLYVVNAGSNSVSVISTSSNTVSTTVAVGNAPQSIAITPDGTLVYVANTKDSTLSLIQTSTNTVSSTLPLATPFGMAIASPPPASQATTLTLAPPNVIFSGQSLGTPSSQTISITNPGTPSVSLTSIGLTGPNTSDFSLNNTCPQPPGALGGGASCSLQVVFTPVATGSFTAFVTINSTNGVASSTQSVPLAGTGNALVAAFSNLTPSQSIFAGTSSVTLAGTIGSGTTFPAPGETLSVSINGASQTVTIGSNGAFTTAFSTANIPASPTPYVITYSYAGDANFGAATDSSTTLTVNPVVSSFTLTVTDIGTGNGAVTDNLQQIDCITTAGVQSGTCSASYSAGTPVTLTATPSGNTTFAGWGGACSGSTTCVVTMNSAQSVTASFTPPPQLINLTFNPGTTVTGMATYDCPSNPNPTPTNPCTDPNAHALALSIPQVLTAFTVTVQASEVPPSMGNGICPNGDTPTQDFDCRFVTFFTYQTNANGDKVVPLCYPYANGNCVHYQVYSGTPGVEPNPSNYVGPIDWEVSWNNDAFVPPAPYTGSIPQLYDDPDYPVTPTSPYGTNCATPMLVNGNPTNPPIFCQFEFNITTAFLPNKKVDAGITGRTKQFNDVAVAFPPANVGNLTITDAPLSATVVAGSPIGYTITVTNSAGGAVTGATLTDALPAGTNVNWTISPTYAGPGTCAITGAIGAQVLSCSFGTIAASQTFTISLRSASSSTGTFTDTATTVVGTQQILSIATLTVQGITASFSNLTPSQTITAGVASINLAGVIGGSSSYPASGEKVSITIGSVTQQATIGANGAFSAAFPTTALAASTTPYTITYSYTSDGIFTSATNTSTTLTVTPSTTSALVISPSSINFGQVPLGGLALNEVTLKNTGKTAMAISKIAMSKTGVGDFDDFFVLSLCPSTLKAGASCVLGVGYVPDRDDSIGAVTSTSVVITDNAAGSPQSVPLQAETINPKASLSSSFLNFGSQKVGTTSAGKTVTITSTGTSPLILNSITVTGAYSLASSTTCAAGTTLAPNHSCSITINFDPTKSGLQAGAVNIADNTLFGKHVLLLTGTGK